MRKITLILMVLIALIILVPTPGEAKTPGWHLTMKRFWLAEGQGVWANVQYQHIHGQSLYWEAIHIGDLYQQQGIGFGYTLLQNSSFHLFSTIGVDEYRLGTQENSLFRTDLTLDIELPIGDLTLEGVLVLDDLVGIFPRYQLNYALPIYRDQVQMNLGVGNLLGSKDGMAIWTGIGF